MHNETRAVLVKPGDVLLIGNVGDTMGHDMGAAAAVLEQMTGVRVLIFAGDIDMAAVHAHGETGG